MSLFFEDNSKLKLSLDNLPVRNSNDEILSMVNNLKEDMAANADKEFQSTGTKVMYYGDRHREFCLSYPLMFRSIVRGTLDDQTLSAFLATRQKLESGELSKESAQNHLVDLGVETIKKRSQTSRRET